MSRDTPSAGRFAVRAAMLVLPMVGMALVVPRVLERMRKPGAVEQIKGLDAAGVAAITGRPLDAAKDAAAKAGKDPAAPTGDVPARAPEKATLLQEAAAAKAEAELAKSRTSWEKVTVLAPREVKKSGAPERFPFDGFAVSVETEPEGAAVLLDGRPLGPSPVMSSVSCAVGQRLRVRAEHPKAGAREATVECGANELVKLALKLAPPPAAR